MGALRGYAVGWHVLSDQTGFAAVQAQRGDLLAAEEASALRGIAQDANAVPDTSGLSHLAACLNNDAWLTDVQVHRRIASFLQLASHGTFHHNVGTEVP